MTAKQMSLNLYQGNHGGRRPGSGRLRIRSQGVAHRTREKVGVRTPLHINFKLRTPIKNKLCLSLLKRAIINARSHGLCVVHYSLQSNHVHLIVEARDNTLLTRGMRSLTVTFSKGIGKGRVQLERYHLHVLRSLKETKNAVKYVIRSEQRHSRLKRAYVTSYSSLCFVRKLSDLAKEEGLVLVKGKIEEVNFLSHPLGWMLLQVNQQIC